MKKMDNISEANFERTTSPSGRSPSGRTSDPLAGHSDAPVEQTDVQRWATSLNRSFPLTLFVGSLLALSLVLLFLMSINHAFDFHDEFEAMHTTWKMFQGQEIYDDFIQHHHPFTYYTLLPLYALFGSTTEVLIAARVFMFFQLLAMFALTYLIAWEVYRKHLTALTGTLLLSLTTLFTAKAIEIRPDVPQSLLSLLGLYLMVRFFRTRSLWLLVASGLAFGVSILFLQKGIVFAGLAGLVLLGRWLFGRDVTFAQGLLFAGSVIAATLPYALYLLLSAQMQSFIFWNFTYNTLYYELRGWEAGKLVRNTYALYSDNHFLLLLFAGSLLFLRKRRLEWELLFLAAGVFGFTLATGRHNLQYYLLIFPFVAILAAQSLTVGLRGYKAVAALVLVFVSLMPFANYVADIALDTNGPQLAKIQYVLDLTDEDDYVYDGNITFNLFRRDVDFIWYMAGEPYKAAETLAILMDYDYNIYEAIERFEPEVISNFGIEDMSDPRIANHYVRSSEYDDLFIRVE